MIHRCGIECIEVRRGRLFYACAKCKHKTRVPLGQSSLGRRLLGLPKVGKIGLTGVMGVRTSEAEEFPKLTRKQKSCAPRYIREEMRDLKKTGRWVSRQQAIAVGLSRARKHC